MNFGWAIERLKEGRKVCRAGWNGKGMFLYLTTTEDLSYPPLPGGQAWKSGAFESLPFIIMKTVDGKLVPWLASQTDVLSEDWQEAV